MGASSTRECSLLLCNNYMMHQNRSSHATVIVLSLNVLLAAAAEAQGTLKLPVLLQLQPANTEQGEGLLHHMLL